VGVSLVCDGRERLLSGERVSDAAKILMPLRPEFLSINCTPVKGTTLALKQLARATTLPLCVYANAGRATDDPGVWKFDPHMSVSTYVKEARQWVKLGARIVGSCCGTGPDYTHALVAAFKQAS
ncbi:MAG: homocysteine S-methyltransferase family protein, partial [bacterium]